MIQNVDCMPEHSYWVYLKKTPRSSHDADKMVSPPCDAVVCKGLLSFHVAHFLTSHPHTSMPIVHKMNKRQSLTWRPRNAGGNRSKSFTAPGSCATYHDGFMVLNFGFFVMDSVMACVDTTETSDAFLPRLSIIHHDALTLLLTRFHL